MAGKIYSGLGKVALITAGLLTGLTGIVSAQEKKQATTIYNFDYASHRTGYQGKIFNYNLLSDGSASQTDKNGVSIEPIWFWDIDNDGKFGEAEKRALKSGIQIYMNPAFNDAANAKFWEMASEYSSLKEKLKQTERGSEARDKANHELIGKYEKDLKDLRDQIAAGAPKEATPNASSPNPNVPEAQKKKSDLELYFDASGTTNAIGGRAGLRGKVAGMFGMGVSVSGAYGFPETIESVTTQPTSTGRYFSGSITNENRIKIGADLELYLGDDNGSLFCGVGPAVWIYGQRTSEELRDSSNNVVKSNTNNEIKVTPSLDAYIGYNIKWFRFLVGWDSFNKFYAETGVSLPIGSPDKKQ